MLWLFDMIDYKPRILFHFVVLGGKIWQVKMKDGQ